MQTVNCSYYLKKLKSMQANCDSEYLGADSEISSEVLKYFAVESEIVVKQQECTPDTVDLDEYEIAMAG